MTEIQALRKQTMSCFEGLSQRVISLGAISSHATPQPSMLGFLQSESKLGQHSSESDPQMAGTVPMALPCPTPYPMAPNIPNAELFMLLKSLPRTRTGDYEVPEWLVEHFKHLLQPT
jgi:hypothetical protein